MRQRYTTIVATVLAQKTGLSVQAIENEIKTLSDAQLDTLIEKNDEDIALYLQTKLAGTPA